jgi:hypothetical protein
MTRNAELRSNVRAIIKCALEFYAKCSRSGRMAAQELSAMGRNFPVGNPSRPARISGDRIMSDIADLQSNLCGFSAEAARRIATSIASVASARQMAAYPEPSPPGR